MGYLSDSLKKYYSRKAKDIIFKGDVSLSNLALLMWENLGFQKIDASVLSRVINGKRLFTPSQLQSFCHILDIRGGQKEFLFQCLSKDYFKRDNVNINSHLVSENDLIDIFENIASNATTLFYKGKSQQVIQQTDIINTLYEKISVNKLSKSKLEKLFEKYGYYLFLKERAIAGTMPQHHAARSITSTAILLTELSQMYSIKNLYSYAQILFGDIYYMHGTYSVKQNEEYFKKAIFHSNNAFSTLEDFHIEKLSALRLMIASACYIRDTKTIQYAEKQARNLLPIQSLNAITNMTHLSKIITKGKVVSNNADPFEFEGKIIEHFGKNINSATDAYFELSDIKTRLETFALLKLRDRNILLPLMRRGLDLAQEDYPRHKIFFQKQLKLLS